MTGRRRRLLAIALLIAAATLPACSSTPTTASAGLPSPPSQTSQTAARTPGSDATTPGRTTPRLGAVSDRYADLTYWHCHPDKTDDVCDTADRRATIVGPDGLSPAPEPAAATDPSIDCFYAYPTVSLDQDVGIRSFDLPVNPLEVVVTQGAFAPFDEVCRLFAPRYEQVTPAGYRSPQAVEHSAVGDAEVEEAFDHYLATENDGRPFVLIGHSQGTHHLVRLLQKRFDGDGAEATQLRERLVSALMLGPVGMVVVKAGTDAGGTFERLPLCRAATQTGCVVAYDSYAASSPPVSGAPDPGLERACTNPAKLAEPETSTLLSGGRFGRFSEGIETPVEIWPGFYAARCAKDAAGQPFLEISVAAAEGDGRVEDLFRRYTPALHRIDPNLAMGDLLALVATQAAAVRLS